MRLLTTGVTHRGLVRPNNEDSGFCGHHLALVADGVGGGAAGEIASATTTWAITAQAARRTTEAPEVVLRAAVRAAQLAVRAGADADPERVGMATTLTAVLAASSGFALAHVGDSRAYVWRDGDLTRITHDDTFVAEQVEGGRMTPEEARHHPWRNVVLRSINGDVTTAADIRPLALQLGDRVLIASDGLTDLVSEAQIAVLLSTHADLSAVESLRDAALSLGGRDNVTVVLARVVDGEPVGPDGQLLGAAADPANVVDPTGVHTVRSA